MLRLVDCGGEVAVGIAVVHLFLIFARRRWDVHNEGYAVNQRLGQLSDIWLYDAGVLGWVSTDAEEEEVPENLESGRLEAASGRIRAGLTKRMGARTRMMKPNRRTSSTMMYMMHRIPKISHHR